MLPSELPTITWRCGLDLNPLNVHNDDDARWLLSLVWPEHSQRRRRLASAIKLAQSSELSLHQGDLVSDLPDILATVPRDALLVVFHTAVLVYVSEDARRDFANVLTETSKHRNIVWISNESATVVPEITALAPPVRPVEKILGRTWLRHGKRNDEILAIAHPHGADLHWLAD